MVPIQYKTVTNSFSRECFVTLPAIGQERNLDKGKYQLTNSGKGIMLYTVPISSQGGSNSHPLEQTISLPPGSLVPFAHSWQP
jgi:hypothetical protein